MTRNNNRFRRTVNEGLGLLAIIGISTGLIVFSSEEIDSENLAGSENCYLSKEDAGLPMTRADVDCDSVVIGTGSSAKLIFPQKGNDCLNYMQRGKDGMCEYFPPKYSN